MRRLIAVLAALGLVLVLGASQALAADKPNDNGKGPKDNDTKVQLLAINDFHGHLEPTTPGTIQVGCCNPVLNSSGVQTGWAARTVPAGGVEYLATHIKNLREQNSNTITVGAGDLIGASPLISGLFHDEPAIEALNAIGLDVSGVGNHEFDEGIDELLRMQNGGCTTVDGCRRRSVPGRRSSSTSRRTCSARGRTRPILPAVRDPEDRQREDRVHRAHPRGDARRRHAVRGRRPRLPGRGRDRPTRWSRSSATRTACAAFVVLLHQGGFQNPPAIPVFPAPANPDAYTDVNKCVNFGGAEITDDRRTASTRRSTSSSAPTRTRRTSARSDGKLVTSASSFGRVVTDIDLVIDHQTKDVKSATRRQRDRHPGRREGRGVDGDRRPVPAGSRADREPDRRLDHGEHPARSATPRAARTPPARSRSAT